MARRPPTRSLGLLAAATLTVISGWVFLAGTVVPALGTMRFGFPSYYTSSRLAIDGAWGPAVYDNAWFSDRTLERTDGRIAEIYRPNPPMMSLLALPIASVDIESARRLWLAADLALIAITITALVAALPALRPPARVLAFVALFLWWAPLQETVGLGQAYALMLALQAVALWAIVRERPIAAGLSLGVAAATKLAAVPVLVVLIARGSLPIVAVALVTTITLGGLTVGFAGLDGWTRFIAVLADDVLRPPASLSVTAYQSATGMFQHLFAPDARWNPGAVADLPALATLGPLVATVVALGMTVWLGRTGRVDLAVAAAIASGVLVLNLAQEYHFAMLLVPAVVALARLLESAKRRALDASWLAVAVLLLGTALPYEDPTLAGGWAALLAYPRLYGAWLLWAWLIRELWLDRRAAQADRVAAGRALERPSHEAAIAR